MSRYDWGGTHPAVDRLRESIEPARQDDDEKWAQCEETVNLALAARTSLWDGVLGKILERSR